ncbi:MAG: tripartite tricarboxylate transporter substrate binding protein [Lysobacteraceae bacterium]|nr:MAG: tripartite tricarboxylate transporter substrate binding protein [Xanthomonadaceae bacterium]
MNKETSMKKQLMKTLIGALALGLGATAWAQAQAQPPGNFLNGATIKLIVPFAAGGGVDGAARLLARQMQTRLNVPVIVENRAGANGTVGGSAVKNAPADGHTLLFSATTHILSKQVMAAAPYDPLTDFAPVARVGEAPLLMVISPTLAPQKLGEVVTAAKQQPDKWTAALPAMGAPSHLATLLFAKQGGLPNLTMIPYKGTAPALVDVAGGHSQILMDSIVSILPMAKSGKVKPIAVTSAKRSSIAPDIPTAAEVGMPGLVYLTWYGVWAPKDTPADRVQFLNQVANEATAELVKAGSLASLGIEPVSETVEQFKKVIATDSALAGDLLKGAGFKPE